MTVGREIASRRSFFSAAAGGALSRVLKRVWHGLARRGRDYSDNNTLYRAFVSPPGPVLPLRFFSPPPSFRSRPQNTSNLCRATLLFSRRGRSGHLIMLPPMQHISLPFPLAWRPARPARQVCRRWRARRPWPMTTRRNCLAARRNAWQESLAKRILQ